MTDGLINMYLKYQIGKFCGKCYLVCSKTLSVHRNQNYSAYQLNNIKKIEAQAAFPLEVLSIENITPPPFLAFIARSSTMGA